MNQKRMAVVGLVSAVLAIGTGAAGAGTAVAAPHTTPAPGVTCQGLRCDNTNNRAVTITGTFLCPQTRYFKAKLKPSSLTYVPNPTCPNGRPGVRAFFPDM
ncbi:hypothetical protein [Allokutzneria oryzae]|uniref:Secreted protein n=1 Tax=Allokutzneria oryzae TaxID=1378989 RepID=A0ABV5ZTE6_9PSEU